MQNKDFNSAFWKLFHELSTSGTPSNHFEWMLPTIRALPEWVHHAMGMEVFSVWEKVWTTLLFPCVRLTRRKKSKAQLRAIIAKSDTKAKENPSIFREILNSDLPPAEKSVDRLWHDAQIFNIAGSETTAWTLGILTYYLLTKPEILRRLREELETVIKDGKIEETNTSALEQLPYLVSDLEDEQAKMKK